MKRNSALLYLKHRIPNVYKRLLFNKFPIIQKINKKKRVCANLAMIMKNSKIQK